MSLGTLVHTCGRLWVVFSMSLEDPCTHLWTVVGGV